MTFAAFDMCTIFIRPCDLDGVWWIKLPTPNGHTNFSILRLAIPELLVTQSDHITITWNGHCACAVSRDLSPEAKKLIRIFEIPDPNLRRAYTLCHSQGATTTTPCYRQK